jgi:exodeoxyribonuclease VII small subunit
VAKKAETTISFEESLAKLEETVQQLEDGQLGLTESLSRYEEGVRLLKNCHQALAAAEKKIALLTGIDSKGNGKLEPFDEEAMSLDEKKAARSRRRSQKRNEPDSDPEADMDTQQGLF